MLFPVGSRDGLCSKDMLGWELGGLIDVVGFRNISLGWVVVSNVGLLNSKLGFSVWKDLKSMLGDWLGVSPPRNRWVDFGIGFDCPLIGKNRFIINNVLSA